MCKYINLIRRHLEIIFDVVFVFTLPDLIFSPVSAVDKYYRRLIGHCSHVRDLHNPLKKSIPKSRFIIILTTVAQVESIKRFNVQFLRKQRIVQLSLTILTPELKSQASLRQ